MHIVQQNAGIHPCISRPVTLQNGMQQPILQSQLQRRMHSVDESHHPFVEVVLICLPAAS